jgi:hypothetical protein
MKTSNDFLLVTIQKFNDFAKANPLVSLHLFLNQNKYVAGDTVFFKAFFLDSDFKFVKGNQILEAELRDQAGNILQNNSYRIIEGKAENQIVLAKNITPGKYTLVSYSQWMKNFDLKYFSSTDITITGRYKIEEQVETKKPFSFSIFPEGGHLVAGVMNKLIIQSNYVGEVIIKDKSGKPITRFFIGEDGLGECKIKPEQFTTYVAEAGENKVEIAQAETNAIALLLDSSQGITESKELGIYTSSNSIFKDQPIYLFVTAQNKVTFSTLIQLAGRDSLKIRIPPKGIEEGLNQIFILDDSGNSLAERIFWRTPADIKISFNSNQVMRSRQKASIAIAMVDDLGNPVEGEGAVLICNAGLFDSFSISNFLRDVFLSNLPELKNKIANLSDETWNKQSDRYLIPSTWERIPWRKIIAGQWAKPVHKFKYSLGLTGTARFKESKEPLPDSAKIAIYLQHHLIGYDIYTINKGHFELPFMFDFWDDDKVFYTAENNGKSFDKEVLIELDNISNSPQSKATLARQNDKADTYGEFRHKKEIIDRSFNFYSSLQTKPKKENPNQEFEDELGAADWSMKTEDYLVFPTMEELIHELLSFAKFRKHGNEGAIRIVLIENGQNKFSTEDPLYIIDGVLTKNTQFFLSLKPTDLQSIKIVRDKVKLTRLGSIAKSGIILIHTKKELQQKVASLSNTFSIEGLTQTIPFISKDYSKATNPRTPDFRSTIWWEPKLQFDASGKCIFNFFPSDDNGSVELLMQGISKEGKPFHFNKKIEINK